MVLIISVIDVCKLLITYYIVHATCYILRATANVIEDQRRIAPRLVIIAVRWGIHRTRFRFGFLL